VVNTALQFVAGVSGPLMDAFYVRSYLDRRTIVATKAACQTITHFAKLIYFLNVAGSQRGEMEAVTMTIAVAMAIAGTSLSKLMLERMSDTQFRRWTKAIIMSIGSVYLFQGAYAYLGP
jgi:uncharacterized membrane protein YfcA